MDLSKANFSAHYTQISYFAANQRRSLARASLSCINLQLQQPTVATMLLDPKRLIDRSIADLTQLSSLFAAELRDNGPLRSPELMACEEAVATIINLIPRLQIARNAPIALPRASGCPRCDD